MSASLRERAGAHRVLDPPGELPQPAWRVDPRAPLRPSEIAVHVRRVSLDAWSFRRLWSDAGGNETAFADALRALVRERGKLHNPDTDSGGTLVGTITEVGEEAAAERGVTPGELVVVLASCSAIPLVLDLVGHVNPRAADIEIDARAIVPLAFPVGRVPSDLDERVVVAAADAAGAPGLVHDLTRASTRVTVLGANGTAGLLACAAALDRGARRVVGVDVETSALERTGLAESVRADARHALAVVDALAAADASEADVVAHVAAARDCEAAAVAAVAAEGTVVLFSLATSFQRCVNVADVFGKRPVMLVSNALRRHHAELAYDLLRRHPALRAELAGRVGAGA